MAENTFTILYGSQTGQAKAIAEEIYEQAEGYDLIAKLLCLSSTDKKFSIEKEKCVVFVVSTTGDGEPPDTVAKFWRRLRKKTLDSTFLKGLHFALLGLGDTNYTNFCNCSKNLNSRLLDLGATHFYPPGFADDAVGTYSSLYAVELNYNFVIDPEVNQKQFRLEDINCLNMETTLLREDESLAVVEPWIEGLWAALQKELNSSGHESEDNSLLSSSMQIKIEENPAQTTPTKDNRLPSPAETTNEDTSKALIHEDVLQNGLVLEKSSVDQTNSSEDTKTVAQDKIPSLRVSTVPLSKSDLSIPILPTSYLSITFTDEVRRDTSSCLWQGGAEFPGSASPVTQSKLISACRMTKDDAVKTAYCLTLDTGDVVLDYNPGDSFGIICPNSEDEVDALITRLGYQDQANHLFTLTAKEPVENKKRAKGRPDYIPQECTIRQALTSCLEIRAVPRKAFLRVLCEYTSDIEEKRRLQELCSKEGAADYSTFIREQHVSFIDILNAFPSCKPSFERLLEHLPRLLPRPYSVACSPLQSPTLLKFVFNVVEFPHIDNVRSKRCGVCTGWLQKSSKHLTKKNEDNQVSFEKRFQDLSINSHQEVNVVHRNPTGFHLPHDIQCPLIMIGPGTGVAPFIGFLQHRQHLQKQATPDTKFGTTWLFYGCRHKESDFLFRDELMYFNKNDVLTKLVVSFSRDPPPADSSITIKPPKYVQDNIKIWGKELCNLIYDSGAFIFVCGDARNMAKNVLETFIDVLQNVKGLSHEEAKKDIWKLRQEHRYVEDVWT